MIPVGWDNPNSRRKRRCPFGTAPALRTAACWTARTALAALVCLAGWSAAPAAITGSVQVATGGGLAMTVDTRWLDGPAYRPVRIRFTPTAPVTADRRLRVEILLFRNRAGEGYDFRVVRDVDVPAGSGPVVATVAVPQMDQWHDYAVNVREDGLPVAGLSMGTSGPTLPYWSLTGPEVLPAVLVVGDRSVDTFGLASVLPVSKYNGEQPIEVQTSAAGSPRVPLPTATQLTASELPQRWLDYTNLDVVCLSLDELAGLAESRPEAFRAVLDWVASGGNLWVYGVGDEFRRIGKLEGLLGLTPGSGDTASKPAARGWSKPDLSRLNTRGDVMDNDEYPAEVYVDPKTGVIFERRPLPRKPAVALPPLKKPHFLLRELQMGLVVALGPENPFPGTREQWAAVLAAVGPQRYLWNLRHGLSMVDVNHGFWDFLIPGVGLVPAVQFGVLITLFVLAIGPLNYWLLRRWKRLHLLVVTVPLGAAAVTLALFAYALLADGLGTRVRVRSVTHLDQRSGRAVCWSRMSYYAGLSPSGGLRFPAEAAVYPLEALPPAAARNQSPQRRELAWEDDQWLQSGWLRARTPTQFVTVRCRPSDRGLAIAPVEGDRNHVEVTNRLGTPIRQLLVRTADGTCYWAEGVEQDATVRATRIRLADAMERLGATYYENQPRLPAGMHSGSFQTSYQRRWSYPSRRGPGGSPSPWTSRLERSLQMLQLYPPLPSSFPDGDPARVMASPPDWQGPPPGVTGPTEPQPGSYVATVEESPEVATGIPSARQEAGYHVILGEF